MGELFHLSSCAREMYASIGKGIPLSHCWYVYGVSPDKVRHSWAFVELAYSKL